MSTYSLHFILTLWYTPTQRTRCNEHTSTESNGTSGVQGSGVPAQQAPRHRSGQAGYCEASRGSGCKKTRKPLFPNVKRPDYALASLLASAGFASVQCQSPIPARHGVALAKPGPFHSYTLSNHAAIINGQSPIPQSCCPT